jgi:hypothetical protein
LLALLVADHTVFFATVPADTLLRGTGDDLFDAPGSKGGSRLYKRRKKVVFCPTTKRLEAFATMRATFSCAESEVMDLASYTIKERLLASL